MALNSSKIWSTVGILGCALSLQAAASSFCESMGAVSGEKIVSEIFKNNGPLGKSRKLAPIPVPKKEESSEEFSSLLILTERGAEQLRKADVPTNPGVVLYPASGYDASTPLHFFPDATVIVAVDTSAFHISKNDWFYPEIGNQTTTRFLGSGDMVDVESIAGRIVARIKAVKPTARIRRVMEFADVEHYGTMTSGKSSHGFIEYDNGEGTPIQFYVHIQSDFSDQRKSLETFWAKPLMNAGVGAVLTKGATGMETSAMASFDTLAEQMLKRNGGVFVSDGVFPIIFFERHGLSVTVTDIQMGYNRMTFSRVRPQR